MAQSRYEARLDRVIDYIHAHIEEDLRFETLAEIACLSAYHWHRIYVAMRGETIAATIRRLRLLRAADRLANSEMPLASVAQRARYGSTDAFAHAFKEAYGMTPMAYRANGSHAAFKVANREGDSNGFPIFVETLPSIRCAAVAHQGPYIQIDHAMGQLFSQLLAQGLMPSEPRMMALFFDDPDLVPQNQLRSQACLPISEDIALAPPLLDTVLRGGCYARLRYKGPYADMKNAYRWLFGVWLPSSGYEAEEAPAFEAYLNDPRDTSPQDLLTDIHLPLKAL
ncbi:AraC family transcriptional regulator [Asticcacaulis sp. 201]|uniref:AraC family transcriptional regulator n=1 Tax=Asticcacaulis sp. 201 TaxID=3028787 RepID=UPI0029168B36|nr:AraC family transcriptional regulator [Asticcacaulis sp. 201]MDV6332679.1 AraC family transcriptional regulator [Asticcacaulis sp. 201]